MFRAQSMEQWHGEHESHWGMCFLLIPRDLLTGRSPIEGVQCKVYKIRLKNLENGRPFAALDHSSTQDESGTVGFEVLTAVVMKYSIFWVITPCSPLKVNRPF
jgi:hypothetical protein